MKYASGLYFCNDDCPLHTWQEGAMKIWDEPAKSEAPKQYATNSGCLQALGSVMPYMAAFWVLAAVVAMLVLL